ncbi:Asp-tRNA(Asn)/Glu-tRNA(Gln) amidotransferase subunit GatA [Acanthopleuribacter pedis]|uniref:Glutamyl-tRNA(Gln) amidotransferase subunit A n=1 Tax=Acanthopleuribacter pedis TaxID=442870 RepID=A0A8J7Q6Z7_9BACT|nr:Asp-tRNA(Asn)/Glu-tRNA(Gln) amidotransferase subunit GatA [Acanthopleuribacter pedis]MBO1317929.1 Asp-tRNA(Asn)/Glu-tRNA(Gln) amidotransferase subunit GatA [Acanthopleuribacter pedis]
MDMFASCNTLIEQLESGAVTSEALVKEALGAIEARDGEVGAFLKVHEEAAVTQARDIDRRRAAGEQVGALAGLPVALKDNINIEGRRTTCASKILENFTAPFDATVVTRLKQADAVLLGKTNMDEFAMGSSSEFSALGTTRNPHNLERVPGGSSGGSTAAVAAGMVPLALGSSTGGSIRQPAAFCGVVGLKPSYGRVSRYGLVAYGSSLDQIGPVAADVAGVARLYDAIAGPCDRDATSAQVAHTPAFPGLTEPGAPLRIGLPREFLDGGLQPEIQAALNNLVARYREAGATIVDVSLPHTEYAISAYYLIATAEASSNLARFDGVRYGFRTQEDGNLRDMYVRSRSEGFGMEVKRRILLGTYCLSSGYYEGYYLQAQKVRTKIIEDFQKAFEHVDVLLAPTTPTTAFAAGAKLDDPMAMYLADIFTVTANLAGIPALSLPAGCDNDGLPIGLQLLAPHLGENRLLQAAYQAEQLLR